MYVSVIFLTLKNKEIWRRKWQPPPVFLPTVHGVAELQTAEHAPSFYSIHGGKEIKCYEYIQRTSMSLYIYIHAYIYIHIYVYTEL